MTDDELLLKSLNSYFAEIKEEILWVTGDDDFSRELKDELNDYKEILESLIPEIQGVDSLYELDEDEQSFILECLEDYMEVFVIDGTNPEQLEKDEEEYSQLCSLFFDLCGDENEDDEN